ncbi:MAG TPA: ABC transporter ATP-binding protein [Trueperaceae bacterium]
MLAPASHAPAGKQEFHAPDAYRYDHRSPLRWVLSHLLRYRLLAFGFVVFSVLGGVILSAVPLVTGRAFDVVLDPRASSGRLLLLAAAILGLSVLRSLFELATSFSIEVLGQRLERDARDELYASLLGKSQTFHNRQRVGDIMARASNDVRQLNPMMNPGVALITDSALSTIVPLAFIAFLDLRLLIAPLLFVLAFVWALRLYMRQLNPVSGAMRRQFGIMNAGLNETITGIEVVKSVASEAQEKRKFVQDAGLYRDIFVSHGQVQARYLPILLLGFALTGAFAHGLYLLSIGALSVGQLVAYMGLMGGLRFPAFISIFTFSLVQLGLAGAERILELMRQETELDENPAGHAARMAGEIVFEDVGFAYDDHSAVGSEAAARRAGLRRLSFRARPGQTVAIVGQTGSGKSTLTKLVNRSYDADSGRILIDGIDVRDWHLASLRSQISVIEQDVFLFSRSIAANIAFGLGEEATRARIEAAARAAQAHDFIMGFADGYDTVIGERGVTLSGGQRQRLAIARALLTDPRVLILDDSTSAIDSATEDAIQKAINKVLEGRTTLMITHRLSQIRRADTILVLHQGELVDQGNHQQLLERCALYQRIFARAG